MGELGSLTEHFLSSRVDYFSGNSMKLYIND